MRYRYRTYENPSSTTGDSLTFPLVNVTIKKGRKTINIDCLVDSGASESLFSLDIAKLLEIDLAKAETQDYIGIGNIAITGFKSSIMLKLSGFDTWLSF